MDAEMTARRPSSATRTVSAGLLAATLGLSLSLGLSGCGKKGAPSPPGPADQIHYPRIYPAQ